MRAILVSIFLLAAISVQAAPWLRAEGTGFIAFDSITSIDETLIDPNHYNGLFLEYGLSASTTLILTGGVKHDQDGFVTLILRKPARRDAKTWALAYDLGIGADRIDKQFDRHLRLGASVGRGGLFQNNSGWFQIDAHSLLRSGQSPSLKIEATLGSKGRKDWLYLLQGTAEAADGTPWFVTLSPSLAIPLRSRQHIQIGLSASSLDGGRYGVQSSVWYRF